MLSTCSLLLFSASEARPTFKEKSIWNGKKMRLWNTEAKDLKLTFGWKNWNFKKTWFFLWQGSSLGAGLSGPWLWGCNPWKDFIHKDQKIFSWRYRVQPWWRIRVQIKEIMQINYRANPIRVQPRLDHTLLALVRKQIWKYQNKFGWKYLDSSSILTMKKAKIYENPEYENIKTWAVEITCQLKFPPSQSWQ